MSAINLTLLIVIISFPSFEILSLLAETCRANVDKEYYGDDNDEAVTPLQNDDDDEAEAKRWMDKFDTDEYVEDDDDDGQKDQKTRQDDDQVGIDAAPDQDEEAESIKTHKTPDELVEDNPQVTRDYYDTASIDDVANENNSSENLLHNENVFPDDNSDYNDQNEASTISPYSHRDGVLQEQGDHKHYDGYHDRTFPSMMVKVYRGATTRTVANDTFAPWSYFIKFPPEDETTTTTPKSTNKL